MPGLSLVEKRAAAMIANQEFIVRQFSLILPSRARLTRRE